MAPATIDTVVPGDVQGDDEMAEPSNGVAQLAADNLVTEAAACSNRRIVRADQLQGDSDRMWSVYMTSPNVLTGIGYRTLQQSGGYPAQGGTGTGG